MSHSGTLHRDPSGTEPSHLESPGSLYRKGSRLCSWAPMPSFLTVGLKHWVMVAGSLAQKSRTRASGCILMSRNGSFRIMPSCYHIQYCWSWNLGWAFRKNSQIHIPKLASQGVLWHVLEGEEDHLLKLRYGDQEVATVPAATLLLDIHESGDQTLQGCCKRKVIAHSYPSVYGFARQQKTSKQQEGDLLLFSASQISPVHPTGTI